MYRKIITTAIVLILAAATLAAQGGGESYRHSHQSSYYGNPMPRYRGEWFSLGFGAGTDAFTMPLQGKADAQSFSSLILNAEFAMYPQRAQGNLVLKLSFGLLQQMDVFGRSPEGGTLDAVAMFRWQHSSGFALAIGGGCYFPGFTDELKPSPEAVIEPSFAFNLEPQNAAASMGTVRLSAPVEVRYDSSLSQWYMSVSVAATVYVI